MMVTGQGGPIDRDDGSRASQVTAQEVSPQVFGFSKRFVAIGAAAILAVTALGTAAFAASGVPTPTPGATTPVVPAATTPASSSTATPRTDYGQVYVQKLAAALGIRQTTLIAKVKQAEIDTINQAVANGDLAKNQADAEIQRIQQSTGIGPLGGLFGGHGHGRGGYGVGGGTPIVDQQAVLSAVAGKLGLSVADLQTQLSSGQTLASLAKAHNVQVQDLFDAAANAAKPQLDQAVKDGKLTQAQADQVYREIQQSQIGLGGPGGVGGMKGGRGHR